MKKIFTPFLLLALFTLGQYSCQSPKSEEIIVLRASMEIKPDSIEAFKGIAKVLVEATRKEPNCLMYTLYQDAYNPSLFFFYEEYANQEAVAFHGKQAHLAAFRARRDPMLIGKPEATKYTASAVK